MRITRVTADAFGALRNKTLELGPGLNVVVGPNESGKSTWHAAIYAALAGYPAVDRTPADARFAAYRKPRPGADWAVSAELDLGVVAGHDGARGFDGEARFDGARHILLHQNLIDAAQSIALEQLGNERLDISAEIRADGSLDAARWLGFDRRSYAATSWIEQAGARSALISVDGRTALQLAVAACVEEDEAVAALEQIESVLRGYIGNEGTAGSAIARAVAEVERCRATRDRAAGLQERRREAVTALATATGASEIARKKLAASIALAARAEADALRAQAPADLEPVAVGVSGYPPPLFAPEPGMGRADALVHSTVADAEQALRDLDRLIAELAEREAAAAVEAAPATDSGEPDGEESDSEEPDSEEPDESDPAREAVDADREWTRPHRSSPWSHWSRPPAEDSDAEPGDDMVEPAVAGTLNGHAAFGAYPPSDGSLDDDSEHDGDVAQSELDADGAIDREAAAAADGSPAYPTDEPRRLAGLLPSLDRMPGLDRVWGLDRVPGLGWIRQLDRTALLSISAAAGTIFVLGFVLAIALPSVLAMVVAVVAALVLLLALLQLTPSGLARREREAVAATPRAPIRPRPSSVDLKRDLELRREVALTRLSSALTARGWRARPATAEDDYERYVRSCAEEAVRLEAELAEWDERRRAHDERVLVAQRRADELEQAADPYDLNLPYRRDPDSARGAFDEAQAALREATEAVARVDREIAAHPSVLGAEAAMADAQRAVARLRRLDRVLVRARDELTIAREAVLRDIAAGITPRLTDYLAELTDRRYSAAEVTDLRDRIGDSLLLREPELGSFSTSESTYMFTRVALGQHLAGDAPQGPLLVDDITSSADSTRIRRLLRILRRIAAQRQVVVFAHQSQVGKWARGRIAADPGIRLIRLRSIHDGPEIETPPAPTPRATAA